jgi:Mrp family chromosome partitioning ATPase
VLILGPKVNIVLLVYRAGKTAKNALLRTVEQLKTAAIPIRGVILNYITPEIEVSPNYYYQYYKYYPSDKKG